MTKKRTNPPPKPKKEAIKELPTAESSSSTSNDAQTVVFETEQVKSSETPPTTDQAQEQSPHSGTLVTPEIQTILRGWVPVLINWPYELMAEKHGAHWKLSKQDLDVATAAAMPVAEKYGAWLLQKAPELVVFAVTMVMVTLPKVAKDKQLKKAAEVKKAEVPDGSKQSS